MTSKRFRVLLWVALTSLVILTASAGRSALSSQSPAPPRTFDANAMASVTLPLATADASPVQMSAETYYQIPIAPIYKNYPVYHPDKEPAGYFASLQQLEPESHSTLVA